MEVVDEEWLEARVQRDLGGFFPVSHGNFPKKTADFPELMHQIEMKKGFSKAIRFGTFTVLIHRTNSRPWG
jgi:hypothetical protein